MKHVLNVTVSSTVNTAISAQKANLHAILSLRHQVHWSVKTWAAIFGNRIVGLYLLRQRLTVRPNWCPRWHTFIGSNCPTFPVWLSTNTLTLISCTLQLFCTDCVNFCTSFTGYWIPRRWIGHGGSVVQPAWSPNLSPLDFPLWRHLKELVYQSHLLQRFSRLSADCLHFYGLYNVWSCAVSHCIANARASR